MKLSPLFNFFRMKLIKLLLIFILSANVFQTFADNHNISPNEEKAFLDEADDWIDEMPDGLQDHLSDAVQHSLRGFFSELSYFRNQNPIDSGIYSKVSVSWFKTGRNKDIPVKLYFPEGAKDNHISSVLIYFHGGGWTMGSVNATDKFCRALVAEGNIMVASVDYPLSPENAADKIIKTAKEAYECLYEEFGEKRNVSLGGDGAGGNIALSAFFAMTEEFKSTVNSILLYYPILNLNPDKKTESWKKYSRGYGLDSRVLEAYLESYATQSASELAFSSINASDQNIEDLPPLLLITPGRDILLEDEIAFRNRLRERGKNLHWIEFPGSIHGFISDNNQKTAFNKAVELSVEFLNN